MRKKMMINSKLQDSLRNIGLEETIKTHGVLSRRSKNYPNLILFTYDMFESDMSNPVVQESRGIIFDESNNWEIVSRSFDKFFNHGEGNQAKIDYSTAKFFKKEDGSMISCYYYDNAWKVATTGSPDASGKMGITDKTFSEMFWDTFYACGGSTANLDKSNTYIFELCTPYNKVVVPHKESKVVLLACRSKSGPWQSRVTGIAGLIPWVESFSLNSIDDVILSFENLKGSHFEGYVIEDGSGNRIKVKHPGYVALHHFMDHKLTSPVKLLEIVVNGEVSEVITYFPEYEKDFRDLEFKLNDFKHNLQESYMIYKDIADQKEFAIAISHLKYKSSLFSMRRHGYSVDEIIKNISLSHLLESI